LLCLLYEVFLVREWGFVGGGEGRSGDEIQDRGEGQRVERVVLWLSVVVDVLLGVAALGDAVSILWIDGWYRIHEGVAVYMVIGFLQVVVAAISAWPRIRDSRIAWVKVLYDTETSAGSNHSENLIDISSPIAIPQSPNLPSVSTTTTTPPNPHITTTSLSIRTSITLIALLAILLETHHSYRLLHPILTNPFELFLTITFASNLLILITYFRSHHRPKPSYLLKLVAKKRDIERVRRYSGTAMGDEGPFLTVRGLRAVVRVLVVWDVVVAVCVWWNGGRSDSWAAFWLSWVLIILLFLLALEKKWEGHVLVYLDKFRTVKVSDTEHGGVPAPPQVYRDVDDEV